MLNSNDSDRVTTFIVEAYAPGRGAASRAVRALARGAGIRYLRSILVPLDGRCFHLVEGPSAAAIGEAARAAAIGVVRIVKDVDVRDALSDPASGTA